MFEEAEQTALGDTEDGSPPSVVSTSQNLTKYRFPFRTQAAAKVCTSAKTGYIFVSGGHAWNTSGDFIRVAGERAGQQLAVLVGRSTQATQTGGNIWERWGLAKSKSCS